MKIICFNLGKARHACIVVVALLSVTIIFRFCLVDRGTAQSVLIGKESLYANEELISDLSDLAAEDTKVIEHIRQHLLYPPSQLPYHLTYGIDDDPSEGQSKIVDSIFEGKRNGVFIESGALKGEFLSNTLFLEAHRGWTGLLIEPDDYNFQELLLKHRRATLVKACLSTSQHPQNVIFQNLRDSGRMLEKRLIDSGLLVSGKGLKLQKAQCYPLHSILLATNITTVDYFSLDVEGAEYKILSNIPFDKVHIKVLSVEYNIIQEKPEALVKLMESKGYIHYMKFVSALTHDYIFVKRGLLPLHQTNSLPILKKGSFALPKGSEDLAAFND